MIDVSRLLPFGAFDAKRGAPFVGFELERFWIAKKQDGGWIRYNHHDWEEEADTSKWLEMASNFARETFEMYLLLPSTQLSNKLLPVIKEYRVKFEEQKKRQKIPDNTCPVINEVAEFILARDKAPGRVRIVRRLEIARQANSALRQIGIDWYELCRDLLDELEMTQKLYGQKAKDGYSRGCILPRCERKISDRNKSGVCTHCWNHRPDETAAVWAEVCLKRDTTKRENHNGQC